MDPTKIIGVAVGDSWFEDQLTESGREATMPLESM
jgi:hypothetical protein